VTALVPVHADRAHSELGASVTARFWNCPGSVLASRGAPDRSSEHARRGTAMHELGELCLRQERDAHEFIDRQVDGFTVEEQDAENVQTYVDTCRANWGTWREIEARFDLSPFDPPAPMFGTGDFVSYDEATATLTIVDYKNGWIQVDPRTPQLRYYALGAMLVLGQGRAIRRVVCIIVQRDVVKTAEVDPVELVEWSLELMQHARAALQPGAAFQAGPWCRFCPISGKCTAQADANLKAARAEFSGRALPDPRYLTPEERAGVMNRAEEIKAFLNSVRDVCLAESTPGWKRVPTRPQQEWLDPIEAAETLAAVHEVEAWKPRVPVSPAQARGLVAAKIHVEAAGRKPKLTKKAAEDQARVALAPLISSSSSGWTLAPDNDPRPALVGGGAEFSVLPTEGLTE
jgi:hypothetical protein